jgi:hypothetical protein
MKKPRSSKKPPAVPVPLAVLAEEASLSTLRRQTGLLSRAWAWLQGRQAARSDSQRLRVAETVSLGEKRFVAVVQVAGHDFLVAGGPSNIALLAQLDANEPFEDVLRRTMTVPGKEPEKRKRVVRRKPGKRKPAARPASAPKEPEATLPNQPQAAPFDVSGQMLQKTVTSARKPPLKPKPAVESAYEQAASPAETEDGPHASQFNLPESFRYVLQNTMTGDDNPSARPPRKQNGRGELEQTGHYA